MRSILIQLKHCQNLVMMSLRGQERKGVAIKKFGFELVSHSDTLRYWNGEQRLFHSRGVLIPISSLLNISTVESLDRRVHSIVNKFCDVSIGWMSIIAWSLERTLAKLLMSSP